MTRTHLQTDEHQLHVALQELIGGCAPPDLRARIRDATPAERRAAGARVSFARRPHPRLLAAAVLLLGCIAVVGALLLRDDATDEATGQDPRPEGIVRPLSFDEFDALLDDVEDGLVVRLRLDRRLFDLQGRTFTSFPGRLADHDPPLATALGRLECRGHLLFRETLRPLRMASISSL